MKGANEKGGIYYEWWL